MTDRNRAMTLAAAGCIALTLAGCAGSGGEMQRRSITAADFAGAGAPALPAEPARVVPTLSELQARGGADDVAVVIGAPEPPADGADEPAPQPAPEAAQPKRVVIDQMVGQINGVPIYAGDFFEPMETRLRQEARRLGPAEWLDELRSSVSQNLQAELLDEVLWMEFYASVEPEQRQGLLNVIENIRSNMRRQAGGSAEQANQRALREEGLTLDQAARETFGQGSRPHLAQGHRAALPARFRQVQPARRRRHARHQDPQ